MRTASAASLTPEDEAPLDIHIFDIFDAPSRLGESSKLLSRASTARAATAAASTSRSANVRSERPRGAHTIEPLPAPVMFDGPATHKHLSFCAYGTQYEHSHNMTSSSPSTERRVLSTLPPPVIFDGPSQLRPYARNSEEQHKMSSPITFVLAATSMGVAYYAYTKLQDTSPQIRLRSVVTI